MLLMMDDEPREFPAEKVNHILHPDELSFIDDALDLIEAKRIIRELGTVCEKALTLRGLMMAINERYALEGEKREYRERVMKIEIEIRSMIFEAEEFLSKK